MIRSLLALVLVACSARAAQAQPRIFLVTTAPGVNIEVMDWGGSGPPLVFLAGSGHTAREFEDFAPLFTDRYRALAISRRASGASSDVPPEGPHDLVDDIAAVLDSLHLPKAVLIGHSFAGVEMALFGERHPSRCDALIYLDAAYDYTDPEVERIYTETPPPPGPPMSSADSASVAAVQAYTMRVSGFSIPESEVRATRRFDENGRMIGRIQGAPWPDVNRSPRWEAVQCRSAAIYPVPAPPETWRHFGELSAANREAASAYYHAFSRWTAGQRQKFGPWPQNRVIEFPSHNHYFFLEKPEEAKQAIVDYLSTLP